MSEVTLRSGLRVATESLGGGCKTGRPWDDVVQALIKSGELFLHDGESVTGIEVDLKYGLTLVIEKAPTK